MALTVCVHAQIRKIACVGAERIIQPVFRAERVVVAARRREGRSNALANGV